MCHWRLRNTYDSVGESAAGCQTDDPWIGGDPLKIPLPGTAGFSSGLPRPAYSTRQRANGIAFRYRSEATAFAHSGPGWGRLLKSQERWTAFPIKEVHISDQKDRIAEFHERNPGGAKRKTEVPRRTRAEGTMTVDDFFQGRRWCSLAGS